MKNTLLIPALLDHHWPLLRWAFESEDWQAVVLEDRVGIEELGLRNPRKTGGTVTFENSLNSREILDLSRLLLEYREEDL